MLTNEGIGRRYRPATIRLIKIGNNKHPMSGVFVLFLKLQLTYNKKHEKDPNLSKFLLTCFLSLRLYYQADRI